MEKQFNSRSLSTDRKVTVGEGGDGGANFFIQDERKVQLGITVSHEEIPVFVLATLASAGIEPREPGTWTVGERDFLEHIAHEVQRHVAAVAERAAAAKERATLEREAFELYRVSRHENKSTPAASWEAAKKEGGLVEPEFMAIARMSRTLHKESK